MLNGQSAAACCYRARRSARAHTIQNTEHTKISKNFKKKNYSAYQCGQKSTRALASSSAAFRWRALPREEWTLSHSVSTLVAVAARRRHQRRRRRRWQLRRRRRRRLHLAALFARGGGEAHHGGSRLRPAGAIAAAAAAAIAAIAVDHPARRPQQRRANG